MEKKYVQTQAENFIIQETISLEKHSNKCIHPQGKKLKQQGFYSKAITLKLMIKGGKKILEGLPW